MTDSSTAEKEDDSKNWEIDLSYIQSLPRFQNTDMYEQIAAMEKEFKKICDQRDKSYNYEMRSEFKRLKSFSTWKKNCTYSPQEIADAGFYYTGLDSSYQCFCCGIVICTTSCRSTPFADHQNFQPDCLFVNGKDAGNIPKYDVRVRISQALPAEELSKYKQEVVRLESFEKWPFYAKTEPAVLAAAGFFFTGCKDKVQCFSCNGSLANWEVDDNPWKEHAKWFPECKYLQSKKSEEEISQYIKNYSGFIGLTGKHYITEVINIPKLEETCTRTGNLDPDLNIFADEEVRLESFKTWPKDAKKSPKDIAAAGFFYSGKDDIVRCFCCAKCLFKWEEEDDPWKDHERSCYDCRYLTAKRAELEKRENPSSVLTSPNVQETESGSRENHFSQPNGASVILDDWINVAKNLCLQLAKKYKSTQFSKMFPFHPSSCISVDIRYLYSELSMISKNTKNETLQEDVMLPELLRNLHDVTVVEGEAGSGKSALLKKIAVMWASKCCPILERFKLVFYICLGSLSDSQGVADAISRQLLGPKSSLSEMSLKNILHHLKNQVLFLLDGYGEASSVSKHVEALVHKNHIDKLCIIIATRSNRISRVRRFASTVLSITNFPFYSIMYMLRKLFSHDADFLKTFGVNVIISQTLQSMLKSPLFALVICISFVQHSKSVIFSTTAIYKAYLMYNTLKYSEEPEKMTTSMVLCGELALKSFFKSCFEFTDKDLSEAGIDGDEAIRLGFLNKFTVQRPHPIYKFLHPCFQEYLAGKRLSEYFESEVEDQIKKGLHILQQIDTFLKIAGPYYFILKHACTLSPKATPHIISYLFDITKSNSFLNCQSGSQSFLNYHPEQNLIVQHLLVSLYCNPKGISQHVTHFLLDLVLNSAYESNSVLESSSEILKFLEGKTLYFTSQLSEGVLLHFLEEYPETFSLLHSICFNIFGSKKESNVFSASTDTLQKQERPTVEEEYAAAYQVYNVTAEDQNIDSISSIRKQILRHVPEYFIAPFVAAKKCNKKVRVLKLNVHNMDAFKDCDQKNLTKVLAIATEIELSLHKSKGLSGIIKPAVELYSTLFTKCSIYESELNEEDQKLIQLMTSLHSIELTVSKDENPPDHLLSNLNKFVSLKELSLITSGSQCIINKIPDDFVTFKGMEKLVIEVTDLKEDSSKLVSLVQNFSSLITFHLSCQYFPATEDLMTALCSCKQLREIVLNVPQMSEDELTALASSLASITTLHILDLYSQYFTSTEASEVFANSLGLLSHLEVLKLPQGAGITATANLIVHQFWHLPHLTHLEFTNTLNDDGVLELAKVAKDGALYGLQKLDLSANHNITDSGWKDFFLLLDNMKSLWDLTLSRKYTHALKPHPVTVRAFVQCVSRLPNLVKINMFGWLLDEQDLNMFNNMKNHHPQSKRMRLQWQWMLPFQAIIHE